MFGTFAPEVKAVVYGLRTNVDTFNPITITVMDWKALFKKMRTADSWSDALGYFFGPPDWSAAAKEVSAL